MLIVMENKEVSTILGSPDAPFINDRLIPSGRLFTNYTAVAHPSLPNDLAMTAGGTLGKLGTDAVERFGLTRLRAAKRARPLPL